MIKLDIIIGNVSLMDYIDWDLNCPANDPEMFARRMVAEMDLPTEFV